MKYSGPMLVVKDIEKSKAFYTKILQVRVISDLGANATLTGGLSLQTEESWIQFTGCDQDFFTYGGNVAEYYFEEDNFDEFISRIENENIEFIGGVSTMPWGQKVIRFYDPDHHVIEVGESIPVMIKKMAEDGMTVEAIVSKTGMKKGIIERILKK